MLTCSALFRRNLKESARLQGRDWRVYIVARGGAHWETSGPTRNGAIFLLGPARARPWQLSVGCDQLFAVMECSRSQKVSCARRVQNRRTMENCVLVKKNGTTFPWQRIFSGLRFFSSLLRTVRWDLLSWWRVRRAWPSDLGKGRPRLWF